MKIYIENDDKIFIKDNCIYVFAQNEKYCFDKSEIEEINIITTDLGPFYDDMGLTIKVSRKEDVVVFIMSEHPLYKKFRFNLVGNNGCEAQTRPLHKVTYGTGVAVATNSDLS